MSTSQNGWPVIDRAKNPEKIATYTVPGTQVRLPLLVGDAATCLLYVAERFHNEVEKLTAGWCWGFAARNVKGSTTVASNHSSGTAEDLNAPAHPLATLPTKNFTAKQIAAVHKILADCDGVIRWGGDYSGRKDGMHFEINAGSAKVKALAIKIRKEREANTPTATISKTLVPGSDYHRQVLLWQKTLNERIKAGLEVDGDFGKKTEAATMRFKSGSKVPLLVADRANPTVGRLTVTSAGLKWTGK